MFVVPNVPVNVLEDNLEWHISRVCRVTAERRDCLAHDSSRPAPQTDVPTAGTIAARRH
jgi:hypothetical protein